MEKIKNDEVSITKVSVTKTEDIKSFAESTMNELLGWYGLESTRQEVKASRKARSFSGSNNDSEGESVKFSDGCGWCGKNVDDSTSVISATAVFCSELCFSQSRRASFKRNKTCDWCRHSRNSVSYIDTQDHATQLQFCSDKCLNQYKMHIFCRETQAHLELHPHLHGSESTSGGLITPDLWLKNCGSPTANIISPSSSPKASEMSSQNIPISTQIASIPESIPLISVAPSTKLLAMDNKRNRSRPSRKFKKGCPSTITSIGASNMPCDVPQDLRIRQTPPVEETATLCDNLKRSPKIENVQNNRTFFEDNLGFRENNNIEPRDTSSESKFTSENLKEILGKLLPPPTTFVPYPVILPLPIPIPIPIPIPKMFKTNTGKELIELKDSTVQTDAVDDSNNNNDLDKADSIISQKNSTGVILGNRRLLRKRKPSDKKTKVFLKHKKTVSTLP